MDAINAQAKRKKKSISLSSTLVIICYLFFCDAVNFYHPFTRLFLNKRTFVFISDKHAYN